MTHEEALDLLNDHADGMLTAERRDALEAHLAACAECRRAFAELRGLLEAAGGLPAELSPARDLWPGIEARLSENRRSEPEVRDEGALGAPRRRDSRMRPRLSGPESRTWWLAAALLAVACLGIWTVRNALRPPGADPVAGPSGPALTEEGLAETLQALDAETRQGEGRLLDLSLAGKMTWAGPTLALLAENMKLVDLSINQIRRAWQDDPQDARLSRRLLAAYRSKVELLERARQVIAQS